jgi:hypothetical protein
MEYKEVVALGPLSTRYEKEKMQVLDDGFGSRSVPL